MTTKKNQFKTTRQDGRSNTKVILGLIEKAEPGQVFEYDELSRALSVGASKVFSRRDVQAAVRKAMPAMGKTIQRTMHAVTDVGYRVAKAEEHMGLAVCRQTRATRQLKRGLEILRDTRLDEITDPQARMAHEGHFMVTAAILQQTMALEKRMGRVEAAIAAIAGGKK